MGWEKPEPAARADAEPPKAKASFLTEVKQAHGDLFHTMLIKAYEFDGPPAYTAALQEKAWAFLEAVCKQSYRNGRAAGSSRRKES